MNEFLLLTFSTALGGTRTLRVGHVSPGLTNTAVRNAMVTSTALEGARGRASSARGAALVERTVTPVDIASAI
jgi:hypothetical protein